MDSGREVVVCWVWCKVDLVLCAGDFGCGG
jgi:hypothetical protein